MTSSTLLHPIDHKFSLALQSIAEYKNKEFSCSNPFITTATIVCCLDVSAINLDAVRSNPALEIRTHRKSKTKQYKAFSNSVTVLFDKTKAAKVFVNGKIHITGCTKVAQAISYTTTFCEAMGLHHATITNVQILTLNTAFKLEPRQNLRLPALHEALQNAAAADNIISRYNPDIYQGLVVKVKHPRTSRIITTLIFYTGTMIVTGVRTDDELLHTHKIVLGEVVKAAGSIMC
jgi:TATA-box binding protein (TBP) (component of TFIID and TFIIIB)